mgnify:CR=1 FL=1
MRQAVSKRAGGRCEYCRTPEQASLDAFHVEHIRPLMQGGRSSLENLVWSCLFCAVRKATEFAVHDDLAGELVPLYNPRTQAWDDHFTLDGARILGKSLTGRATVRLLQLNHPDQVETRAALIAAGRW